MTLIDYLLNATLIGLVVLQIRGHRVTAVRLAVPVVLTVWGASQFLHQIPTSGNDVLLEGLLVAVGVALGVLAGLATSVRRVGEGAFARAGSLAAMLWVLGIGARVGFYLWVTHGGAAAVHAFSASAHITSAGAWAAGFILMAMAEVIVRTSTLYAKSVRIGAQVPRGGLRHRGALA